jgi:hypothetical protein
VLLLTVLLLSLGSAAAMPRLLEPAGRVTVRVNGEDVATLSLDRHQRLEYKGVLGVSVVKVEPGRVRFVSSPCPLGICVGQSWASRGGEVRACVPNRVVLEVSGAREGGTDAVTW